MMFNWLSVVAEDDMAHSGGLLGKYVGASQNHAGLCNRDWMLLRYRACPA